MGAFGLWLQDYLRKLTAERYYSQLSPQDKALHKERVEWHVMKIAREREVLWKEERKKVNPEGGFTMQELADIAHIVEERHVEAVRRMSESRKTALERAAFAKALYL